MRQRAGRSTRRTPTESQSQHHDSSSTRIRRTPVSPLAMRAPVVQTKLEVNEPGDPFEQQADAVADSVMRSPLPAAPLATPPASAGPDLRRMAQEDEPCIECDQNPRRIQRQALPDEETIQRQPLPREETIQRQALPDDETVQLQPRPEEESVQRQPQPEEPVIQRQALPADETLQRQAVPTEETVQRQDLPDDETVQRDGQGTPSVSAKTASIIRSPGLGNPLSPGTRSRIEPHLGADLSHVQVHTDGRAAQAASSLRARAFTYNNHIFLNGTESSSNLSLLAHESTHVVQQGGAVRRQPQEAERETSITRSNGAGAPAPETPTAASTAPTAAAEASATSASAAPTATTAAAEASAPVAPTPAEAVAPAAPAPAVEAPEAAPGETAPGAEAKAAPAGAGAAPAVGGAAPSDGLLMPEPPTSLSPAAEQRLTGVQKRAGATAQTQQTMPNAKSSVASARGAVTEPQAESQARAEQALVTALEERPEPSAEIEELCERIRRVIREKRPPDEESLVKAEPKAMAEQAGGELNQNVESDAQRVQGEYNQMQQAPQGTPASQPTPLAGTPSAGESRAVNASHAAPEAVPAENVSLDADVEANRQRMEEAGMTSKTAQAVQDGPIAEARKAQGELEETAERDPQAVLAEQEAALSSARSNMADLQARALEALQQARATTTTDRESQQVRMVGSEAQMREQVGRRANEIFKSAQSRVDSLLRDLPKKAIERWKSGVARHAATFKQTLRRVERWIELRHTDKLLAVWDTLTGLPNWVKTEYDRAETEFGDNVCNLMREISREVNGVIAACQALIQQARQDIKTLYDSLPAELQAWAQQEQAHFDEQLNGLSNRVNETRDNFNRDLRERASKAVDDVRQQIHQLREKARGLAGRIADAVTEFMKDPVRAIINGLLSLVGIAPSTFWALVARIQQVIADIAKDPMKFATNLMEALKQGFQGFFNNIKTHLLNGLFQWLFSNMGSVGVTVPTDFSPQGLITFFLQLMGITWARIRRLLAKHVGEQNVALIEQAWQLLSTLIQQGPAGIFELIKEQLNPQPILDMIKQTAIDFLVEALIKQVTVRIFAMFNPVGAIVQAIELIYKLLKWLFENAAKIFTLIETIVKGAASLIAGNVSGMAAAVEKALGGLVPIVIDFLASLLNLGGLPDKIAGAVKRLQGWVERILDRVIGFLADRARALLRRLGLGKEDEGAPATDVRQLAIVALQRELATVDTREDAESAVRHVAEQLRPQGLRLLEIRPGSEEGVSTIYGEASPGFPLGEIKREARPHVPEGRSVTTAVRLTLRVAVSIPGGEIPTTTEDRSRLRARGVILGSGGQPTRTVKAATWNTSPNTMSRRNAKSHAEFHFDAWLDQHPEIRRTVEKIEVRNFNKSPCDSCCDLLAGMLKRIRNEQRENPVLQDAHIYWTTPHRETTVGGIRTLSSAGWIIHAPSSALPSEALQDPALGGRLFFEPTKGLTDVRRLEPPSMARAASPVIRRRR